MRVLLSNTREWCANMLLLTTRLENSGNMSHSVAFEARCAIWEVWERAHRVFSND